MKPNKALYRLKQVSRAWNRELTRFLKHLGICAPAADSYVFVRGEVNGEFTVVVLHVDDQNVMATSKWLLVDFKAALQAQYGIDDIGETKCVLGIEVSRDGARRTIKIWQRKFIQKVLKRFESYDLASFGHVTTPVDPDRFNKPSSDLCPESEETRADSASQP